VPPILLRADEVIELRFRSAKQLDRRRPQWVSCRRQTMSAMAAAFAGSGHGILTAMGTRPRSQAGPPMTLGNMRANGVRSLDVSCWQCHQRTIMSADPWPDHVPVPLRHHRCRCTAELAGTATVREPDRGGDGGKRRTAPGAARRTGLSAPPQGWHWAAISLLEFVIAHS
jgi:hypothetical protein